MDCNVRETSNAVMIDSLATIIEQENRKLEVDKNTGLLAKKTKVFKAQQPLKENENITSQNARFSKDSRCHSPKLSPSHDRVNEIEKLANLFTRSPSFFTTKNNNNNINFNHNHKKALLKGTMSTLTHNEFDDCDKVSTNNNSNNHFISPDFKVKRNVRFGEFSPLNPANQVTSHPFLGIGEYDDKKKKIQELQRKEYLEYLSKLKRDKNTSDLPKLSGYSCEEAFKTAMEDNSSSEPIQLNNKAKYNREDLIQLAPFNDGVESCAFDDVQKKESNRLKQELYRLELSKQIEEKKKLELERKQKEQMDDEAIERVARDQEEKIKKEFEKESEKRTLAQLQKQFQQEKLKNELMQKQRDLEKKSLNVTSEKISQHVSMHIPGRHESFEDDDVEVFHCPPQNPFDNIPLPTTRSRVPRKMVYDEESESVNKTKDISCNTDTFSNQCMNQYISSPLTRQRMERAHVSFDRKSSLKRNEYNPAALLPVTKTLIIDSPLKLAGLDDCEENGTCEGTKLTETTNRNQVPQEVLLGDNHELLRDKHLLSNLGTIRKQLVIEHQKLKQQVKLSQ